MIVCDSCGIPTGETTKSRSDPRYCIYCQDQVTGILKNFQQVRSGCIDAAIRLMGKSRNEAETLADQTLHRLPRWKKKFKKSY
jgi:hypothetical protein